MLIIKWVVMIRKELKETGTKKIVMNYDTDIQYLTDLNNFSVV